VEKWEYLVLSVSDEWSDSNGRKGRLSRDWEASLAALLNDLGNQGWEMSGVGVVSTWRFYFKRPRA
jgi:hypothetical protein